MKSQDNDARYAGRVKDVIKQYDVFKMENIFQRGKFISFRDKKEDFLSYVVQKLKISEEAEILEAEKILEAIELYCGLTVIHHSIDESVNKEWVERQCKELAAEWIDDLKKSIVLKSEKDDSLGNYINNVLETVAIVNKVSEANSKKKKHSNLIDKAAGKIKPLKAKKEYQINKADLEDHLLESYLEAMKAEAEKIVSEMKLEKMRETPPSDLPIIPQVIISNVPETDKSEETDEQSCGSMRITNDDFEKIKEKFGSDDVADEEVLHFMRFREEQAKEFCKVSVFDSTPVILIDGHRIEITQNWQKFLLVHPDLPIERNLIPKVGVSLTDEEWNKINRENFKGKKKKASIPLVTPEQLAEAKKENDDDKDYIDKKTLEMVEKFREDNAEELERLQADELQKEAVKKSLEKKLKATAKQHDDFKDWDEKEKDEVLKEAQDKFEEDIYIKVSLALFKSAGAEKLFNETRQKLWLEVGEKRKKNDAKKRQEEIKEGLRKEFPEFTEAQIESKFQEMFNKTKEEYKQAGKEISELGKNNPNAFKTLVLATIKAANNPAKRRSVMTGLYNSMDKNTLNAPDNSSRNSEGSSYSTEYSTDSSSSDEKEPVGSDGNKGSEKTTKPTDRSNVSKSPESKIRANNVDDLTFVDTQKANDLQNNLNNLLSDEDSVDSKDSSSHSGEDSHSNTSEEEPGVEVKVEKTLANSEEINNITTPDKQGDQLNIDNNNQEGQEEMKELANGKNINNSAKSSTQHTPTRKFGHDGKHPSLVTLGGAVTGNKFTINDNNNNVIMPKSANIPNKNIMEGIDSTEYNPQIFKERREFFGRAFFEGRGIQSNGDCKFNTSKATEATLNNIQKDVETLIGKLSLNDNGEFVDQNGKKCELVSSYKSLDTQLRYKITVGQYEENLPGSVNIGVIKITLPEYKRENLGKEVKVYLDRTPGKPINLHVQMPEKAIEKSRNAVLDLNIGKESKEEPTEKQTIVFAVNDKNNEPNNPKMEFKVKDLAGGQSDSTPDISTLTNTTNESKSKDNSEKKEETEHSKKTGGKADASEKSKKCDVGDLDIGNIDNIDLDKLIKDLESFQDQAEKLESQIKQELVAVGKVSPKLENLKAQLVKINEDIQLIQDVIQIKRDGEQEAEKPVEENQQSKTVSPVNNKPNVNFEINGLKKKNNIELNDKDAKIPELNLDALKQQREKVLEELQSSEERLQQVKEEVARLTNEKEEKEAQIAAIGKEVPESERAVYEMNIASRNDSVALFKETLEKLSKEHDQLKALNDQLIEQIAVLEHERETEDEKALSLISKFGSEKAQAAEKSRIEKEALENQAKNLQNLLDTNTQKSEEKDKEIEALRNQLDKVGAQLNALNSAYDPNGLKGVLNSKIDALTDELRVANVAKDNLEQEKSELQSKFNDNKQLLEDKELTLTQAQADLDKTVTSLENANKHISTLEEEAKKAEKQKVSEINDLQTRNGYSDREISRLKNELKNVNSQLSYLEAGLRDTKTALGNAMNDKLETQHKLELALKDQQKLTNKELEINDLNRKLTAANLSGKNVAEIRQMQLDSANKDAEIQSLKQQLEAEKSKENILSGLQSKYNSAIAKESEEIKGLKSEIASLRNQLKTAQNNVQLSNRHSGTIYDFNKELQEKVRNKDIENNTLRMKLGGLKEVQEQNDLYKTKLKELTKTNNALQAKLADKKEKSKDQKVRINEIGDQLTTTQLQSIQQGKELSGLKSQYNSLKSDAQKSAASIDAEKLLTEAQSKLLLANQKIEDITKELETANREQAVLTNKLKVAEQEQEKLKNGLKNSQIPNKRDSVSGEADHWWNKFRKAEGEKKKLEEKKAKYKALVSNLNSAINGLKTDLASNSVEIKNLNKNLEEAKNGRKDEEGKVEKVLRDIIAILQKELENNRQEKNNLQKCSQDEINRLLSIGNIKKFKDLLDKIKTPVTPSLKDMSGSDGGDIFDPNDAKNGKNHDDNNGKNHNDFGSLEGNDSGEQSSVEDLIRRHFGDNNADGKSIKQPDPNNVNDLNKQIEGLKNLLAYKKQKRADMKGQIKVLQTDKHNLELNNSSLTVSYAKATEQLNAAREAEQKNRENSKLQDELKKSYYDRQLEKSASYVSHSTMDKNKAEGIAEENKKKAEQLQKDKDDLLIQNGDLKGKSSRFEAQVGLLNGQIIKDEEEIKHLRELLHKANAEKQDAQKEDGKISELKIVIQEKDKEISELKRHKANALDQIAMEAQENKDLQEKNSELKNRIEQELESNGKLVTALENAKKIIETGNNEIKDSADRIKDLGSKLNEVEKENEALRQKAEETIREAARQKEEAEKKLQEKKQKWQGKIASEQKAKEEALQRGWGSNPYYNKNSRNDLGSLDDKKRAFKHAAQFNKGRAAELEQASSLFYGIRNDAKINNELYAKKVERKGTGSQEIYYNPKDVKDGKISESHCLFVDRDNNNRIVQGGVKAGAQFSGELYLNAGAGKKPEAWIFKHGKRTNEPTKVESFYSGQSRIARTGNNFISI